MPSFGASRWRRSGWRCSTECFLPWRAGRRSPSPRGAWSDSGIGHGGRTPPWTRREKMEVILLERIEKLGQMGDTVKVKPGFARNYLLPQKKALRNTKANQARFEAERANLEAANLKRREEAEKVAKTMDGLTLLVIRQAGEGGMLYGSVSGRDVADAIKEAGFTVERRHVALDTPIKSLGIYQVRVALHPEVAITVTINVARSQDEGDRALKAAEAGETVIDVVADEAAVEEEAREEADAAVEE